MNRWKQDAERIVPPWALCFGVTMGFLALAVVFCWLLEKL